MRLQSRRAPRTLRPVRLDARSLDAGVRDVVTALNEIPGVTTRTSCEGAGSTDTAQRHADLAYVLFAYPLPLHFRDFLVARLDELARVDIDGVFSRWPSHNRVFLDRLLETTRDYLNPANFVDRCCIRVALTKLRARFSRPLIRGVDTNAAFCLSCEDLVVEPHPVPHRRLPLLHLSADQHTLWFAQFAALPTNQLDAALVEATGWAALIERSRRGDFGTAFQRRWLRYRAGRLGELTTWQLRAGIEEARRERHDLDFFFDATHAVFGWRRGPRG